MDAIDNITIGHTERLYKPVGYTMLTNLVNIVPFCLSIEAVRIIFGAFDGSGQPLDTTRLWYIFGIMAVYMLVMSLAERASYRANFRGAYEMSALGRLALAEHLRKLSLGFLSRRDPGDLSSMLITDFMLAETGISHHLPHSVGKHKRTEKIKWQANPSENQCREPIGRIPARHPGNESLQSVGRPLHPAA